MSRFLPKLFIDYASFWLGALLTAVIVYLFIRFRSVISSAIKNLGSKVLGFRERLTIMSENNYINVLYKHVQSLHLLSDYFPLDDLSITPYCIAPPPALNPGGDNIDPSLIHQTLGYDPYSSLLAAEFNVPLITLPEAMMNNVNICLVGFPGCGKTTAIADCISKLLKSNSLDPRLEYKIPFYTKAHYILSQFPGSDLLEIILSAIQTNQEFHTIPEFPKLLTTAINSGNAVLFIDDLDLLNHRDTNRIANFLAAVERNIPKLQLVVTATPSNLGYLTKTTFEIISIAPWNDQEKHAFLDKLSKCWDQSTNSIPDINHKTSNIKNAMLVVSDVFSTPFEFTLKTWAAFAGDIRSPKAPQVIETFLKRCFPSNTQNTLATLETIALFSLDQEQSGFARKDIRAWFSEGKKGGSVELPEDRLGQLTTILQSAHNSGILHRDGSDGFYITSPTIGGYLAAKGLRRLSKQKVLDILDQPGWALRYETSRFLSAFNPIDQLIPSIKTDQHFMRERIIQSCQWLTYVEPNSPGEIELLKSITKEIHTNKSYLIKTRLVALLAISGNTNAKSIFQHLIKSQDLDTRRAAALGSGLIQDLAAVPQLIKQLNDNFPASTAACYSLGRIASPQSLEAIGDSLLHGNELLRRAAAESLAQNRSEGHPALRDGASRDDLLVRYAVVHGLSLIKESWALEILDKMRIDEDEWVVRDLAQQVYDFQIIGSPYIPKPRLSLDSSSWLHSFASKQGLPEPNAETILETLLEALKTGSDEEKQASLEILPRFGGPELIPDLTDYFSHSNPDVRQQAMLTAWYCSPPGYKIPS